MWVRSTGLGKRNDLLTEFEGLKREGDYWILCMKTIEPVRWKIRVAMTAKDLRSFIRLILEQPASFRLALDLFRHTPGTPPENY